jgi:hypothetical protein
VKRHQEYADGLVKTHGIEKAVKIVTDCLSIANRASQITYFEEADLFINDHGRYEYAKVQSQKVTKRKDKRIKSTRNFYELVLQLLNKGQKNVKKA